MGHIKPSLEVNTIMMVLEKVGNKLIGTRNGFRLIEIKHDALTLNNIAVHR